ncbi:MAG: DNA-directed RNA polymerase subunit K [archaeon]
MDKFTKYETARIIGARALQLAMGAPLLMKRPKELYDTSIIAETEFSSGVLPITIKRPKPVKIEI